MMATLLFTLSRGAWLAFAVTAAVVGFATNRGLVVLLMVVFLVGYRWAPREAVTRADLTVRAVETATAHLKSLWTIPRHCASSNGSRFRRCSWRVLSGDRPGDLSGSGSVERPAFFGPLTPRWSRLARKWARLGSLAISVAGDGGDRLLEARAHRPGEEFRAGGRPWRPCGNALSLSPRLQRRAVPRPHGDHVLLAPGWSVSGLHGSCTRASTVSR